MRKKTNIDIATFDKEEWRNVPGFPGYKVSNHGRIASFMKIVGAEFGVGAEWEIAEKPQRQLKYYYNNRGYAEVNLRKEGETYHVRAAYIVMLAFVGPRPEGMEVCHNDSNKKNNRIDNLRYDTAQGNINDRCPLSPELLTCLRYQVANGENVNNLTEAYGVSRKFIVRACSGESYSTLGSGPVTETKDIHQYKISDGKYRKAIELLESGVNQADVAKQIGVHYSTVSRWVNGSRSKERWNQAKQSLPLDISTV